MFVRVARTNVFQIVRDYAPHVRSSAMFLLSPSRGTIDARYDKGIKVYQVPRFGLFGFRNGQASPPNIVGMPFSFRKNNAFLVPGHEVFLP